MKKINLKGITAETVTGVIILLVALINAILQMFGYNTIPIADDSISQVVSSVFLVVTALYNLYKNRNISLASQKAQQVSDALKAGSLLVEQVDELLDDVRIKE